MSSVDSTDYGTSPRPEQQLRNLFAMLRIHTPIRPKLAAAGVVTLKLIAMTGSGPDSALAGLSEFLTAGDCDFRFPSGGSFVAPPSLAALLWAWLGSSRLCPRKQRALQPGFSALWFCAFMCVHGTPSPPLAVV